MMGHHIRNAKLAIKTAKREWKRAKHPRDVLLAVLIEHAPPELLVRVLSAYENLEKWWSANVKADEPPKAGIVAVKRGAETGASPLPESSLAPLTVPEID